MEIVNFGSKKGCQLANTMNKGEAPLHVSARHLNCRKAAKILLDPKFKAKYII